MLTAIFPGSSKKIEELEASIKSAKASAWDEALEYAYGNREITDDEECFYTNAKESNPYKENKK